ncbi:hypothetical protein LRR18_16010, partial [Mangrovimonas sp. AS39]|nr:hypothetical protein [Mangrovimonas futianensis]
MRKPYLIVFTVLLSAISFAVVPKHASYQPNYQLITDSICTYEEYLEITSDFQNYNSIDLVPTCRIISIYLNSLGSITITPEDIDSNNAGSDFILSQYTFDCSDIGSNIVTITDTSNSTTCNATVIVQDNIAPTAVCQDITVQLDNTGNASIVAQDIDNGSNDACGIASLAIDQTTFDCSNIGDNTVTLTVTDNNSNVSTCTATVTVQDNIAPTAVCQDITVQLDNTGNASIVAQDIDNGSNDACGIASLAIDQTTFDCSNIGDNTVTLTVTDNNSNVSTCTATVTVQDNIAPT